MSDKNSTPISVSVSLSKRQVKEAALTAFGGQDFESFDFLRSLLSQLYDRDRNSRAEFQDRIEALLVSVIDERDDFVFGYGGNSSYQWRKIKYPEKDKKS